MPRDVRSTIVVVGAGIFGLSAALHLRAATDRDILLVEAGEPGAGTTPAGAGFVAPWATVLPHLGAAGLALARYSLDYYRRLADSGADIHYRANGNIVFFNHRRSYEAGVAAIMAGPHVTADTRVLGAREVADLTSGAVDADAIAGGVFMPEGIQLETGLMLSHLMALAEQAGIIVLPRTALRTVRHTGGRLTAAVLAACVDGTDATADIVVSTDTLVLATGAWLNEVLDPLGRRLPLLPFVATRFVTADVGLAATMPTLQGKDFPLWIRESEGGFTWGTTPGAAPAHRLGPRWRSFAPATRRYEDLIEAMRADVERVAAVFPALRGAPPVRVLQGMPVYTVDRQFFLGEVPECRGLWVMGGDNEAGVSHGPGLGRLVADLVTGRPPLCDPSAYRLDRIDPRAHPDPEAVGRRIAESGEGFITDAMRAPLVRR